jgi:hypothetical protein
MDILTGSGTTLVLIAMFSMHYCTFSEHRNGFVLSRNGVSVEEQLSIFLYTCVTGLSSRLVGERFQRSPDTVTRYGGLDIIFQAT